MVFNKTINMIKMESTIHDHDHSTQKDRYSLICIIQLIILQFVLNISQKQIAVVQVMFVEKKIRVNIYLWLQNVYNVYSDDWSMYLCTLM